jgi:predicted amidohydrolase YtcJ
MQSAPPAAVAVPGFTDGHAHLLKDSAGVAFPGTPAAVREFHHRVASAASTPMDVLDPAPPGEVTGRLLAGLRRAAAAGLVEVTEMGMRQWWYLDALDRLQAAGPLPVRVRVYLASGLAEQPACRRPA